MKGLLRIVSILAFLLMGASSNGTPAWNFQFDQWQIAVSKDEVAYPFFIRNVHALRVSGKDYNILYLSKPYIPVSKSFVDTAANSLKIPGQLQTLRAVKGGSIFQFAADHSTQWLSTNGGHLIATVESTKKDAQAMALKHLASVVQK